jgi:superfamily I DNA/RNA helicase
MTLHTSKGLEYQVVFMGMEGRSVPHMRSRTTLAKSRRARLCYVGMTARRLLI